MMTDLKVRSFSMLQAEKMSSRHECTWDAVYHLPGGSCVPCAHSGRISAPWAAVPDLRDGAMGGRRSSRHADAHHLHADCGPHLVSTEHFRSMQESVPAACGAYYYTLNSQCWALAYNARRHPEEERQRLLRRKMMAAAAPTPRSSNNYQSRGLGRALLSDRRGAGAPYKSGSSVTSPNSLLERREAASPACRTPICLNMSASTLSSTCSSQWDLS